jgi:hypothetical protein
VPRRAFRRGAPSLTLLCWQSVVCYTSGTVVYKCALAGCIYSGCACYAQSSIFDMPEAGAGWHQSDANKRPLLSVCSYPTQDRKTALRALYGLVGRFFCMERTVIIPALVKSREKHSVSLVGGSTETDKKQRHFRYNRPRRSLPKMSAAASKNRGVLRHPPMGALCFVTQRPKKVLTW